MRNFFISLNLCVYLLLISYSSLLAEDFSEILYTLNKAPDFISQQKERCLMLKSINFEGLNSEDRLVLIYLNHLLDYIVEHNTSILGNKAYCISKDFNSDNSVPGFYTQSDGLILVNINEDFFLEYSIYTDADIVAILAHELAHNILNHYLEVIDLLKTLYEQDYPKDHQSEQNISDFVKFYLDHYLYITLVQQHEEEADNLGLEIYLNSGFKADNYKKQFIRSFLGAPSIDFSKHVSSDERINIFRELLSQQKAFNTPLEQRLETTISILHQKVDEARKQSPEAFEKFMSDIKYIDPKKSTHPTGFWRFLNIEEQEKKILAKKHIDIASHDTIDTIYFRIDLTNSERLEEIKKFFNTSYLSSTILNYHDVTDPRSYIINELLRNLSFNDSIESHEVNSLLLSRFIANIIRLKSASDFSTLFRLSDVGSPRIFTPSKTLFSTDTMELTIVTDQKNRTDIGGIQKDNSIILRANDLFQIAIMLQVSNDLQKSTPCAELFTNSEPASHTDMPVELKQEILEYSLNNSIQKLFI